jgi:AhpD family alkylhydroperoxidase
VLAAGSLTKRDQEMIKLVISAAGCCDYYAAHNHPAKLAGLKRRGSRSASGQPTGDANRDVLVGLVHKLRSAVQQHRQ